MKVHRLFATLVLEGALVVSGCDPNPDPVDDEADGDASTGSDATADSGDSGPVDTGMPTDMPGGDGDGDGDGDTSTTGAECPESCNAADFAIGGETDWAQGCHPITTICCWVTDACCDVCC